MEPLPLHSRDSVLYNTYHISSISFVSCNVLLDRSYLGTLSNCKVIIVQMVKGLQFMVLFKVYLLFRSRRPILFFSRFKILACNNILLLYGNGDKPCKN